MASAPERNPLNGGTAGRIEPHASQVGAAGAGKGTDESTKAPRRSTTNKVKNHGAVRTVKWYSVNQPELTNLATLQGMSALFMSLTTFFLGVWLSTKQALEMAGKGDLDATTRASWETIQVIFGWASVASALITIILLVFNGLSVLQIYREHDHDG